MGSLSLSKFDVLSSNCSSQLCAGSCLCPRYSKRLGLPLQFHTLFNKIGARAQILLGSPMLTSPCATDTWGRGEEKQKTKLDSQRWAATVPASVGIPETSTAWLLSNLPILKISYITVPAEEAWFVLSHRLQTHFSPSTLQQNSFEVNRVKATWERTWASEPALLLAGCLALPRPILFCASVFSSPSDGM